MSDEFKQEETEVTEAPENEASVTDNEEFKNVLGQEDNPLVVHKKSDASYAEPSANAMNETHTDEERPTLVRHRFRKEQKSHGKAIVILAVIVVLAAVFAALYITGNITFGPKETTTKKKATTTEAVTTLEEKYDGTIVVKGIYLFVNGTEVDGIIGLQDALKYEEPSDTAYKIIVENENSDFLNFEVLKILEEMGFYGKETEIEHIASTGLIAAAETTTLPPETTTKKKNKKKKAAKKQSQQQTTQSNG